MNRALIPATVFAAVLLVSPVAASAAEDDSDMDPVIAYALEAVPGGVAIDSRHAVWPDGMELHVPHPLAYSVLNCPTGRICAFELKTTAGAMLSWPTCATHSTAALPSVKSIANDYPDSILQARNGTTILVSATTGNWKNVSGTVTNVRCLN